MKLKGKSALFAAFLIFMFTVSVAAIYAEEVNIGSLSIDVPDDLTVASQNSTGVTFKNSNGCEFIIDENINTEALAKAYLEGQGYSYVDSVSIDKTITSADGSDAGAYSYTEEQFSGPSGMAYAYVLDSSGETPIIIAFPGPSASTDQPEGMPFDLSTDATGLSSLMNEVAGV